MSKEVEISTSNSRKITVTSSLNEISTDQLGKGLVLSARGVTQPAPTFTACHSGQIYEDDENSLSPARIFDS